MSWLPKSDSKSSKLPVIKKSKWSGQEWCEKVPKESELKNVFEVAVRDDSLTSDLFGNLCEYFTIFQMEHI